MQLHVQVVLECKPHVAEEHEAVLGEQRVGVGLRRVSVGLEERVDLVKSLLAASARATQPPTCVTIETDFWMDTTPQTWTSACPARRRLLVLAASSVAHADAPKADTETMLRAAAGVMTAAPLAAAAARGADALVGFRQATWSGFAPINSALTFGAPTDLDLCDGPRTPPD